jgi:LysR family transcriptional activator of nhaA
VHWLNYQHLLYFWKVAKEGSIVRASAELRLASPTISVQIHQLEDMLGHKLFQREGRGLVLTDEGRVAFRYADSIFATGDALVHAMATGATRRTIRLVVGVSDSLPKCVAQRILVPVFAMEPGVLVACARADSPEGFLAELSSGAIDVVLSDRPAPTTASLRVYSHPLGECGTSFLASPSLAQTLQGVFPQVLDGAPFVFPHAQSSLRRGLDEWCYANAVVPKPVAEMDDAALAAELAEAGIGVIATPDVATKTLTRGDGRLQFVGLAPQLRQRFFAWSLEQKIRHPAVVALCEAARSGLGGAN